MVFLVTGVWHLGLALPFFGTFVVRAMHLLSSLLRLFYEDNFLDAILIVLVLVISIVSACRPIWMHLLVTIVSAVIYRVAKIGWCLFLLSLESWFWCLTWVKVRGSSLVDAFEASDSARKFLLILNTHIVLMALFMIDNWAWNTTVVMRFNLNRSLIVKVLLALNYIRITELLGPTSWKVSGLILARKSD